MKLSTLGAVSAAFALCAAAGAQTTNEPLGVGLRIGLFLPVDENVNDEIGSGFFAFGAEYRLGTIVPTFGAFTSGLSVSVDYFRRDDYGNLPVLLNYLAIKDRWTFSGGVGVGFSSLPGRDDANFAYQLGAAYTLPGNTAYPIFLEAKFFGSERSELNGFGFYAGVRF